MKIGHGSYFFPNEEYSLGLRSIVIRPVVKFQIQQLNRVGLLLFTQLRIQLGLGSTYIRPVVRVHHGPNPFTCRQAHSHTYVCTHKSKLQSVFMKWTRVTIIWIYIYIKGNVLNLRVLNERKYDSFGGGSQRLKPVFLICLFISCPFSSSQTCHKKSGRILRDFLLEVWRK